MCSALRTSLQPPAHGSAHHARATPAGGRCPLDENIRGHISLPVPAGALWPTAACSLRLACYLICSCPQLDIAAGLYRPQHRSFWWEHDGSDTLPWLDCRSCLCSSVVDRSASVTGLRGRKYAEGQPRHAGTNLCHDRLCNRHASKPGEGAIWTVGTERSSWCLQVHLVTYRNHSDQRSSWNHVISWVTDWTRWVVTVAQGHS